MNHLCGVRAESVIQLLKDRSHSGDDAQRADARKVGLVVEGGGMRGAISAGSLLAIDLLGLRNCFDVIYAVSAGSVNAAYFLSGQGALGITVYFDDISSRRFINPWRVWKMVDVDFVYDYLVREVKPLNEEAIRMSRPQFFVTVTNLETGKNVLLDVKDKAASVAKYLKASSALPVLYNRSVSIGKHRFMDGGISGGLPIDWAIEQGCTDILNLVSRPISYVGRSPGWVERSLFRCALGFRYPEMYFTFIRSGPQKQRNRRLATGEEQIDGLNVATISPQASEDSVRRTTIERHKLLAAAHEIANTTFDIFGADKAVLEETFRGFAAVCKR